MTPLKTAKELKKQASARLTGCFGELCTVFFLSVGGLALFVLACLMAAEGLVNSKRDVLYGSGLLRAELALFLTCTAVFIVLVVAVTPFMYGVSWYRIQQIRGNSVHARSIFSCYMSIGKMWQVLRLNSLLLFKILCRLLPYAAVSALAFYAAGFVDRITDGSVIYSISLTAAFILTAVMLYLAVRSNNIYAAVPFLYALEPDRYASEIISESKAIMRKNKGYVGEIMFSVSPWLLPCLIIFPMIFIIPYIQMVYAAAVNEIIVSTRTAEQESNADLEVPLTN